MSVVTQKNLVMKRIIPLILIVGFSCTKERKENFAISTISSEYNTPIFEDAARAEKILQYKSVVDTIFKKFARLEHNPAIAYGIVVDNKLIYANAIGYANLEKKIAA